MPSPSDTGVVVEQPAAKAPPADRARSEPTGRSWARKVLLGGATLLLLLPFVGKAYHIDDPFYVWVAKHLLGDPVDFYGLMINWYGFEQSLAEVNQNPPLVSFYMALASFVFGWSEVGLHTAFILPALGAVLGVEALARRLTCRPLFAALAVLSTPVFLVSATTVMSDVLLLAFYCWAIVLWLRGLDEDRRGLLAAAGVLVALAALTKYFGITLLPLLAVHALWRRASPRVWLAALALPAAILCGYEIYTAALYGKGLLSAAMGYAVQFGGAPGSNRWERGLVGLVFAGGCSATAFFLAPVALKPRRLVTLGACALGVCLVLAFLERLGALPLRGPEGLRWSALAHVWIFAATGVAIVLLPVLDFAERRDAESLLLGLWLIGTLVFAGFVNWTTSGRAVLPLAPPVGLLLARQLDRGAGPVRPARARAAWALLVPACALSLFVAWGDRALADSARRAARAIDRHYDAAAERIWFQGHWGFQYYMQELGHKPLDLRRSELRPGDVVVLPGNNSNVYGLPAGVGAGSEELRVPLDAFAATMSRQLGAGFYCDLWGPLPFALGAIPDERYRVARIEDRFRFGAPLRNHRMPR